MSRKSMLPSAGGENLFQGIKRVCAEAEANGVKLWRLSIGQPVGPALAAARNTAAEAIMSSLEKVHEYQDNGEVGIPGFSQTFIQANVGDRINLSEINDIAYLPIPGIKPMLGLIPMACNGATEIIFVQTMTEPGYPVPATWSDYLNLQNESLPLSSENRFLFHPEADVDPSADLLMLNYPHNPSGQIATENWWHMLCQYCQEGNIRIFNDGAYAMLAHFSEACTLTEVATQYPDLSWAEAFSASKVIGNGTGWRIGAMCGSPDFIGDIATIKGNTDSGFNAALAAGVMQVALEPEMSGAYAIRDKYKERVSILLEILTKRGMRLAVQPKAGFFTLWDLPKKAFGQDIEDAKQFNMLMIEKTGIVGVHFHPYIRYAVVAPIENDDFQGAIKKAFDEAKVEY